MSIQIIKRVTKLFLKKATRSLPVLAFTLSCGCGTALKSPNLANMYNQAAQYHGIERNPVIVIPGILGSRLVDSDSGRVVWGAFGGTSANPANGPDARLTALPMGIGQALSNLTDRVTSDGALDSLSFEILPLPIQLKAYAQILNALGAGGYRDEMLARMGQVDYGDDHFTCFQFDYDWRRSNVENAQLLHEFIETKKHYVKQEWKKRFGIEKETVRFDIVAHSMGGLISRYYLRYGNQILPANGSLPNLNWGGASNLNKVILIATPSGGSAWALSQLVDGLPLKPIVHYPATILDTMPAIFELLPRPRHRSVVYTGTDETVDFYNPEIWKKLKWGLLNPSESRELKKLIPEIETSDERLDIAYDHIKKSLTNARQFHAALDIKGAPPPHVSLQIVAGDAEPTLSLISVHPESGHLHLADFAPGDGTVLRTSALMDERMTGTWKPFLDSPVQWDKTMFLFEDHLGLTRSPVFIDNVLYQLLEEPPLP